MGYDAKKNRKPASRDKLTLDKMLWGTVATMKESGLSPEAVQDLIPVKPVAEEVTTLAAAYQTKLAGLMEKIKP